MVLPGCGTTPFVIASLVVDRLFSSTAPLPPPITQFEPATLGSAVLEVAGNTDDPTQLLSDTTPFITGAGLSGSGAEQPSPTPTADDEVEEDGREGGGGGGGGGLVGELQPPACEIEEKDADDAAAAAPEVSAETTPPPPPPHSRPVYGVLESPCWNQRRQPVLVAGPQGAACVNC